MEEIVEEYGAVVTAIPVVGTFIMLFVKILTNV